MAGGRDHHGLPATAGLADQACLHGQVAIVTGAGAGIGEAVARHLGAAGAAVILLDRDGEAAARVAGGLDGARPLAADVTDWNGLAEQLDDALGGRVPAILVNAAGIFPSAPILDLDEAHWDALLDINLKGVARISQIVARHMQAGGKGGAIVNIGSIQAHRSTAGKAAYAASKAGLEALTRVLALELQPFAIRVNTVAAGPVLTASVRARIAEIAAGAPAGRSMGDTGLRLADPDEIARIVHFLASPAASFVTGAIWTADGGASLR